MAKKLNSGMKIGEINTEILPNQESIVSGAPTLSTCLSSPTCRCCFNCGGNWFCNADQSEIKDLFAFSSIKKWGFQTIASRENSQNLCLIMDGNKGSSEMNINIPSYNKMQYSDQGKKYIWQSGRGQSLNFDIDVSNYELYPYTFTTGLNGFDYIQVTPRGTRKIPTLITDTLCGPTLCLSAMTATTITYPYDRMNYNWYFGENAGIRFDPIESGGTPVAITGPLVSQEGCASFSNVEGDLLFYTDGSTVYTSSGSIMIGGDGTLGSSGTSTQSAIIVPKAESDEYYIFTTDFEGNPDGFEYAIVDMSAQGGDGEVIAPHISLISGGITEKVTACCHENDDEYWVITHLSGSSFFYSYRVSATGIHPPVTTDIGSVHNTARGYMKTSFDGSKLISCLYDEDIVDIFDFNISAGTLSNFITLTGITYDIGPYGVEFSSDNSKFYISEGAGNKIYQGSLNYTLATDIINNLIELPTISGSSFTGLTIFSGASLGALQMGPDEKIYIADRGKPYLHVIHYPNGLGVQCNLQQQDFILSGATTGATSGATSQWGLPNIITCKALSCDRYVYVVPSSQIRFVFDFVFNNFNRLLQDKNKKISYYGEIYKFNSKTREFGETIIHDFSIDNKTLSESNTHPVGIPIQSFTDGEYMIKSYLNWRPGTLISNQIGLSNSNVQTQKYIGDMYWLYNSETCWYFPFMHEAEKPKFSNSTPIPPGGISSLKVHSTFTQAGVTDYAVPTQWDVLLAYNGSVLMKDVEYSAITTGFSHTIRLLFEPLDDQVLTYAYIPEANVSGTYMDMYQVTSPIASGPTGGQGDERVYFNTDHSTYEYWLQSAVASDVVFSLNGSVQAINVDYYMSSSDARRLIIDDSITLKVTDILGAFYEPTAPVIGFVNATAFHVPFYVNIAPLTTTGIFTIQITSIDDEKFENIIYSYSTSYEIDKPSYEILVNLYNASAGERYRYRVVNQKQLITINGDIICSFAFSEPETGIEILITSNADKTY